MVARLQGDYGGRAARRAGGELAERINLGVRGAGAAVVALGEQFAAWGEQHAADLRIHAAGRTERGELEAAPHCRIHAKTSHLSV